MKRSLPSCLSLKSSSNVPSASHEDVLVNRRASFSYAENFRIRTLQARFKHFVGRARTPRPAEVTYMTRSGRQCNLACVHGSPRGGELALPRNASLKRAVIRWNIG